MPIHRAVEALRDTTAPPGLVAVAIAALAEAVQQQVPVPSPTARLLYNAVIRSPDAPWVSNATTALGEIATAGVVAEVLALLSEPGIGVALADACLDVLSGPAAARHVTERDLLAIAELAQGRLVQRAANTLRSVADRHQVGQETVKMIADGWSRRPDKASRLAALDLIDDLAQDAGQNLIERLLSDEHSAVRATAALRIVDLFDRDTGLALVERCLTTEQHNLVRGDLLRAKGDLLTAPWESA